MSGYPDAIQGAVLARVQRGDKEMPLGMILACRAADALGVAVSHSGPTLTPVDYAAALKAHAAFSVPGVILKEPVHGGTTGVVSLRELGPVTYAGNAENLGASRLGAGFFALQGPLLDLWAKARASGLITEESYGKIIVVMKQGLIALPEASMTAGDWNDFVEQVKPVWAAYAKGQVDEAVRLAVASTKNAEFWDSVGAVVQGVRDAPANAVVGAFSAVGSVLASLGWKNWLLIGGVGFVVFAWKAGPRLLAKKAKA